MFRCTKCRYHPTLPRNATGGDTPMWPSVGAGSTWTLSKCPGCGALFASANPTMVGFVPDEVKKDPEVTICAFEDLVLPKWIALVYGNYGVSAADVGWKYAKPSVVELRADTAEECWGLLSAGALTDGDSLDDIRLKHLTYGVKVRLFKVEEVSFPWFDAYVAERTKREEEAAKRSADEAEEEALRELAAKRGYSLTKTT